MLAAARRTAVASIAAVEYAAAQVDGGHTTPSTGVLAQEWRLLRSLNAWGRCLRPIGPKTGKDLAMQLVHGRPSGQRNAAMTMATAADALSHSVTDHHGQKGHQHSRQHGHRDQQRMAVRRRHRQLIGVETLSQALEGVGQSEAK